jgi:hypothetical protein
MQTCPNCGCRVYKLGCVNCDEAHFIEEQELLTEQYGKDDPQQEKEEKERNPFTRVGPHS